jgi:uncharacterized protein
MTRSLIPWIILIVTLLADFYGFSAVKSAFHNSNEKTKNIAYIIYWSFTVFMVIYFICSLVFNFRENSTPRSRFMTGVFMGIFVSKLILIIFLLAEDMFRGISYLYNHFQPAANINTDRRQFLDSVFLGIAALPVFAFIHGMIKTAYDYQILKVKVPIVGLPDALVGTTIAQISDVHSGSFSETEPLRNAVESINALNPDIFVFTGDLVNNKAKEYTPYIDIFKNIKAKYGQFSILGNHDYGDYVDWDTDELKSENLATIKQYHKESNWELLCNENRILNINGEKLALIGVENWGAKMHFKKYGNLNQAYAGTESIATKVLFSHDPSHWDAQVRKGFQDIQLTLSGHTHGMQFGIENKWLKFSPVQWFYTQWAGLYSEGSQHIYVNRGFGFLGYAGRVGIRPEITLLELVKG